MAEPSRLERRVGLEHYLTQGQGIGGRLRATPEDFVVEELPRPPAVAKGPGKYTIATLRATNWETNRLVREMARRLRISNRAIFFTGTKDKRAVKTQQMAIQAPEDAVRALDLPGVEVLATFRADRAPKLGDLVGNRFHIVVRQVEVEASTAASRVEGIAAELAAAGGAPNFFGLQRFGSLRPVTQEVGARIVRGDFEGAVMAYLGAPQPEESDGVATARRQIQDRHDFVTALTYFPSHLHFERVLIEHLAKRPDDWIGALRRLPQNLTTMFVYAYQSLLFNRIVSMRLRECGDATTLFEGDLLVPLDPDGNPESDTLVPVRGTNLEKCARQVAKGRAFPTAVLYGLEVPLAAGPMGAIEARVLEAEGIRREDFLVPDMPELASTGIRRAIGLRTMDLTHEPAGEGAHAFRFRLPKGSYATCVLREFMKTPEALHY